MKLFFLVYNLYMCHWVCSCHRTTSHIFYFVYFRFFFLLELTNKWCLTLCQLKTVRHTLRENGWCACCVCVLIETAKPASRLRSCCFAAIVILTMNSTSKQHSMFNSTRVAPFFLFPPNEMNELHVNILLLFNK